MQRDKTELPFSPSPAPSQSQLLQSSGRTDELPHLEINSYTLTSESFVGDVFLTSFSFSVRELKSGEIFPSQGAASVSQKEEDTENYSLPDPFFLEYRVCPTGSPLDSQTCLYGRTRNFKEILSIPLTQKGLELESHVRLEQSSTRDKPDPWQTFKSSLKPAPIPDQNPQRTKNLISLLRLHDNAILKMRVDISQFKELAQSIAEDLKKPTGCLIKLSKERKEAISKLDELGEEGLENFFLSEELASLLNLSPELKRKTLSQLLIEDSSLLKDLSGGGGKALKFDKPIINQILESMGGHAGINLDALAQILASGIGGVAAGVSLVLELKGIWDWRTFIRKERTVKVDGKSVLLTRDKGRGLLYTDAKPEVFYIDDPYTKRVLTDSSGEPYVFSRDYIETQEIRREKGILWVGESPAQRELVRNMAEEGTKVFGKLEVSSDGKLSKWNNTRYGEFDPKSIAPTHDEDSPETRGVPRTLPLEGKLGANYKQSRLVKQGIKTFFVVVPLVKAMISVGLIVFSAVKINELSLAEGACSRFVNIDEKVKGLMKSLIVTRLILDDTKLKILELLESP